MQHQRDAHTAKRKLPPVSTAKGGVLPGVDLTSFSVLEEADDLEYVERLKRGFETSRPSPRRRPERGGR